MAFGRRPSSAFLMTLSRSRASASASLALASRHRSVRRPWCRPNRAEADRHRGRPRHPRPRSPAATGICAGERSEPTRVILSRLPPGGVGLCRSGGPPQAAAPTRVHAGLSDDSVVLDALVDGGMSGRGTDGGFGAGADRSQRGGEPPRAHRAARSEAPPARLPVDDPSAPGTAAADTQDASGCTIGRSGRQCHSEQILYFTFLGPRPGLFGIDARPRALPDVMQAPRTVAEAAGLRAGALVAADDHGWAVDLDDGSSSPRRCVFPHLRAL